jgi:hypothetical protein
VKAQVAASRAKPEVKLTANDENAAPDDALKSAITKKDGKQKEPDAKAAVAEPSVTVVKQAASLPKEIEVEEKPNEVVQTKHQLVKASAQFAVAKVSEPTWDDLDADDEFDPMMVSEYVVEIFEYMKDLEVGSAYVMVLSHRYLRISYILAAASNHAQSQIHGITKGSEMEDALYSHRLAYRSPSQVSLTTRNLIPRGEHYR